MGIREVGGNRFVRLHVQIYFVVHLDYLARRDVEPVCYIEHVNLLDVLPVYNLLGCKDNEVVVYYVRGGSKNVLIQKNGNTLDIEYLELLLVKHRLVCPDLEALLNHSGYYLFREMEGGDHHKKIGVFFAGKNTLDFQFL